MESPFANRKIWFLTGSQDLYGPEVLAQVEEQSKQVVENLNASDEAIKRLFTNMTQAERDDLLAELRGETVE